MKIGPRNLLATTRKLTLWLIVCGGFVSILGCPPKHESASETPLNTSVPLTARFTFTPEFPGINQVVTFDGSTSLAGTGGRTIDNYEWDFNDDGLYEEINSVPTTTHSYPSANTYTVHLRVRDDTSNTAVTTKQ